MKENDGTMNLYAIVPTYAPLAEVRLTLAKDDADAMSDGVYVAARDAVGGYCSPAAYVYLVARDVHQVGEAVATDAPAEWKWAHPGVEENAARLAEFEVELDGASAAESR